MPYKYYLPTELSGSPIKMWMKWQLAVLTWHNYNICIFAVHSDTQDECMSIRRRRCHMTVRKAQAFKNSPAHNVDVANGMEIWDFHKFHECSGDVHCSSVVSSMRITAFPPFPNLKTMYPVCQHGNGVVGACCSSLGVDVVLLCDEYAKHNLHYFIDGEMSTTSKI